MIKSHKLTEKIIQSYPHNCIIIFIITIADNFHFTNHNFNVIGLKRDNEHTKIYKYFCKNIFSLI